MAHNIAPVTRTVRADLETPVSIYLKIRDLYPCSALLESSDYHTGQNAMSMVGISPIGSFKVDADTITLSYPEGQVESLSISAGADVIDSLRSYIESLGVDAEATHGLPNGLLGYTAYDAVRYFESVDIQPKEKIFEDVPEMMYIMYRYFVVVNHYTNMMTIIDNRPDAANPQEGIDALLGVLHNNNIAQYPFATTGDIEPSSLPQEYIDMVANGVRHCHRGDVFQIVPSRRYSRSFHGDEFNVYRALRCINPSPYLFFFDFGAFKVFGSSPETHLRVSGNTAYIDPIAGTFKRTGDDIRDHELAQQLLADPKENAEHIMLVDLARNDLSRSGGKVEIDFLKQIQYYSHVIHMVSRVKATLPDGCDQYRLFASTFPAGTLSGAPKIRAMQLIDEMEPHSRMLYGGCIGYLGFNGDINQAITIRSIVSKGGRLYLQAGAGVVAHSVPESELAETEGKLGALNRAITQANESV